MFGYALIAPRRPAFMSTHRYSLARLFWLHFLELAFDDVHTVRQGALEGFAGVRELHDGFSDVLGVDLSIQGRIQDYSDLLGTGADNFTDWIVQPRPKAFEKLHNGYNPRSVEVAALLGQIRNVGHNCGVVALVHPLDLLSKLESFPLTGSWRG